MIALANQREIVRRAEAMFALANLIKARFTQARPQVNLLALSFLGRAFAGRFVPRNPTDEPASALLKRIHVHQHS